MQHRLASALAAVVTALCAASMTSTPAHAAPRLLTLADLRREVGISEPRFAPDGHTIVFVRTQSDFSANDIRTDLVSIDIRTGAMRDLTADRAGVSSPRWSPDATHLAFLADSDDAESAPDAGTTQIFVIGGGANEDKPRQVTHAPDGVESFAWRPDGAAFAYVSADRPAQPLSFVVGDNDYLAQAAPPPWHLWTIDADGSHARALTRGSRGLPPGEVILPQAAPAAWFSWSKDGRSVAYTRMPNAYKTDGIATEIDVLDVASGATRKLTSHKGEEAGGEYSPDGARVMYWYPRDGDPIGFNDLFVTSASGGTGIDVTHALDRNAIGAAWMPDGRSLLVAAHEGTWARLWRVFLDGRAEKIDTGSVNPGGQPESVPAMDARGDGEIAFAGSEPQRPTELYYMANPVAKPRRLTDLNGGFAALTLGHVSHVDWTGPDGYHEDGVLTYPAGYVPGKKYPLVLQVHGGPNWASVEAFDTDYTGLTQLFAAHGYAVFEPNYRGSDDLGDAYQLAIFNDAGDGPGRDVVAGIAAVERLGFVDPSRIAVSGWSYGGYMTTWLIGHYDIWKCAIAGAAPTDALVDYAISDYNVIGKYYFAGSPWTSRSLRAAYVEQSPITDADKVHAPTLILHDTGDVRVPIVEDYEFFHALRDRGVPVEFVAYPVEGHYPADPLRSEDIYRRWVGWLDKYLR